MFVVFIIAGDEHIIDEKVNRIYEINLYIKNSKYLITVSKHRAIKGVKRNLASDITRRLSVYKETAMGLRFLSQALFYDKIKLNHLNIK